MVGIKNQQNKSNRGSQSSNAGRPHFSGRRSRSELMISSAEVKRWDCLGRDGTATTSIPAALPAVTPGLYITRHSQNISRVQ